MTSNVNLATLSLLKMQNGNRLFNIQFGKKSHVLFPPRRWLKYLPLIHRVPYLTVKCRLIESPDSNNLQINVRLEIVTQKFNRTTPVTILPQFCISTCSLCLLIF